MMMNRLGSINFERFLATAMNVPIIFNTWAPTASPITSPPAITRTTIIIIAAVVVGSIFLCFLAFYTGCIRSIINRRSSGDYNVGGRTAGTDRHEREAVAVTEINGVPCSIALAEYVAVPTYTVAVVAQTADEVDAVSHHYYSKSSSTEKGAVVASNMV